MLGSREKQRPAYLFIKMTINSFFQSGSSLLVLTLLSVNSVSEVIRPRGVAISQAALYDPQKDFTCLDGSRTLPFKFVNDDYCDCHDGSDEPGTSACPMGTFHCTNAGHRPLNIRSSRVNDGICDCCDASDEYATSAKCDSTCSELGKSARAAALRQVELIKQGDELRLQLTRQGKQLKADKQSRLEQLKKDQEEAHRIKTEKESLKSTAEEIESSALEKYRKAAEEERAKQQDDSSKEEEQEAFEQFQKLDSDHDGIVRLEDLTTRTSFDKNKDGEVSDEEARFFLERDEVDWGVFFSRVWPRMKPVLMMEHLFIPPSTALPDVETGTENLDDLPSDDAEEEDLQEAEAEAENEGEGECEGDCEGEAEEVKEEPQYDEGTQQLIEDARKTRLEYDEADRAVKEVEREIRDIEEGLNKDYGQDEEFATLQGQCFVYTDREYTYNMCPFDQVTQIPRSGGADIRLGSWSRWSGNPDKYSVMLFEHGQSCWNGPQRSATVNVGCGLENEVTAVSEPNRCEYLLEFSTPAACHIGSTSRFHDEL